jgi:DNA-binding transcriptional regulator YdaS (Cro superfamily)
METTNLDGLRSFIRKLPDVAAREEFARNCGTSLNYLRKSLSKQRFVPDAKLCIAIERESGGKVRCEELRPDADWQFLRSTDCPVKVEQAA